MRLSKKNMVRVALAATLAIAITSWNCKEAGAHSRSEQASTASAAIVAPAGKSKLNARSKKKIREAKKVLTLRLNERMANEDYDGALTLCKQALQTDNRNEVALFYIAYCHFKQKLGVDVVLDELNTAIRVEPGYVKALMARGYINHENNNPDLALQDFETVLAVEPNNLDAILCMINIHKKRDDTRALAADYSRWIAQFPEEKSAYYCRAKCYRSLGLYSAAIADLQKVSEILVAEYRGSQNAQVLDLIAQIEEEQSGTA